MATRGLAAASAWLGALGRRVGAPPDPSSVASSVALRLLTHNAELREVGRGRRCFVLASGPSTLEQDLSLLRSECVISVNEMFLRLQADDVVPEVLMFIDHDYLRKAPGDRGFLQDFAHAVERTGARAVVPLALHWIPECRTLFNSEPHYILSFGSLLDYPSAAMVPELDFTRPLPGLYTVTHAAVALALYMGFSEIYLLGVDLDYICDPESPIRHGYGANRYHDIDRLTAMDAYRASIAHDYSELVRRTAEHLCALSRLGEIAELRGQHIYNANPGGLVGAFKRRPLESLFDLSPTQR